MTKVFKIHLAAILLAGCTHAPGPGQMLSRTQLSELISGHTLYVPPCPYTSYGILLYLSNNGYGWLDTSLIPGQLPQPSGMSMILARQFTDDLRLCVLASPHIGDMPSFAPALTVCLQVLRSLEASTRLLGRVLDRGNSETSCPLELYPYNAFPPQIVDQYLEQVEVLYGGQIPSWSTSVPATPVQ